MDKASDFGSEDCRFESCHGRSYFLVLKLIYPQTSKPTNLWVFLPIYFGIYSLSKLKQDNALFWDKIVTLVTDHIISLSQLLCNIVLSNSQKLLALKSKF